MLYFVLFYFKYKIVNESRTSVPQTSSGFLPVHKFVYRFQCHFLVCRCILILFIPVSAHSLSQLSVCKSAFLFVYFSPLNGSLVDLNITTAVPKFRRHKVEPTALYHPISLLLHHALTFPLPLFHSTLFSCHQEPTSASEYQMTRT